jgi:hypothetical protein
MEKERTTSGTKKRLFPPPAAIKARAYVNSLEQYEKMWESSIKDPDAFWLEQAKTLTWFKEPTECCASMEVGQPASTENVRPPPEMRYNNQQGG